MDIGTRASMDGLTIILRGVATPAGLELLDRTEAQVKEILGDRVYGSGQDDLATVTGDLLRRAGLTVAAGESCTGGLVAKRLTDVPGSSDYFVGGVTAYSNKVKTALLGVDEALLAAKGAVSEEVAAAMAEGARTLFGTDCAVSTTGVAGPGGGTAEKPIGLVFVGCALAGTTVVEDLHLPGTRDETRQRSAEAAMDLLRRRLSHAR
jgi:nicotinamide-nucleotide amidase